MKDVLEVVFFQIVLGAIVAAGMPFGLLLLSARRPWTERAAAALETRRTSATLWGSGLTITLLAVGVQCAKRAESRWLGWVLLAVLTALFFTGFALGAWTQGRALVARPGGASSMTVGWLARAGIVAIPIFGIPLAAYFVALSVGAPAAVWSAARKATTESSAGSIERS